MKCTFARFVVKLHNVPKFYVNVVILIICVVTRCVQKYLWSSRPVLTVIWHSSSVVKPQMSNVNYLADKQCC
jgi:hypothetical protein